MALFWAISVVWLVIPLLLAAEVGTLRNGTRIVITLAGAGALFALYLWATWRDARLFFRATPAPPPSVWSRYPSIALLAGLGFLLTVSGGYNWLGIIIFAAMVAARRLSIIQSLASFALLDGLVVAAGWLSGASMLTIVTIVGILPAAGVSIICANWAFITNYELQRARRELARLAVTEERLRFARDLHDLLGHTLSLIALKTELAGRLIATAPEQAIREVNDAETAARQALREVREVVVGYRQPTLASELHAARTMLAAADIDCAIHGEDDLSLPTNVEAALSWAVREGVTNVIRHSGAHACDIAFDATAKHMTLTVSDDGSGAKTAEASCTPPMGGSGLRGLRERVATLHGACEAATQPDGGFRLSVTLPLGDQ